MEVRTDFFCLSPSGKLLSWQSNKIIQSKIKVELFTCLYLAYLNECKTFEGNSITPLSSLLPSEKQQCILNMGLWACNVLVKLSYLQVCTCVDCVTLTCRGQPHHQLLSQASRWRCGLHAALPGKHTPQSNTLVKLNQLTRIYEPRLI